MKSEEALIVGSLPAPLRDPLGMLRRRFGRILMVLLAGLAITWMGVRTYVTPVYRAYATVLVANPSIARDFVRPTTEEDDRSAHLNAMVSAALSRQNMVEVIQRHGLYPKLRREEPIDLVVDALRRDLEISPQRGVAPKGFFAAPELFHVAYRYSDPRIASEVANDVTRAFTAEGTRLRSQQASLTADVLREELTRAEGALEDHRATLRALRGMSYDRRHLRELQRELDGLREELADKLTLYTNEHPSVVSLRSRVNRLRSEIRRESERSLPIDRRELDAAEKQEENLAARFADAQQKLNEAQVAAGVELTHQSDQAVVMEWATPPTVPVRTRRNYYAAGAVLSGALALALGLLMELRDPVLLSPDALEDEYSIAVLGSVPRIH